jgi:uncharacterized protein YciI
MTYFAVFGEYGPGRQPGLALSEQPGWRDHANFMDALYEEGVVLLAGTVGVGDSVLLIAEAESRELLEERLRQDPWRETGTLLAPRIEPWQVRLGEFPAPLSPVIAVPSCCQRMQPIPSPAISSLRWPENSQASVTARTSSSGVEVPGLGP